MVMKQGDHVFVMTYLGERCAVVGELASMMYPDKEQAMKNASPMVKVGEYSTLPMRDMTNVGRRFVKLRHVLWTNGTKLLQKKNWRESLEGKWLLALELKPISDEEWLGYSL